MPLPDGVVMKVAGASLTVLRGVPSIRPITHAYGARSRKSFDYENGGYARVFGVTKLKGATGKTPFYSKVHLLRQFDKKVIRAMWSDPITGVFQFDDLDARRSYFVLAEDGAGSFRPVAASMLVAEASTS